ncbi:HNH endonuclease family protein [Streptomyces sp. XM4193]|uniref:HNH endonuclease family protein n=1 Tax=Streptomyces sp. XM4193 TaxID=2929782 RepID=UPI001FFA3CC6|nr:HNH endonuclease family protein [Streptomyces sp. XM4193]MCK1796113.1 HNH endonuclease family protein [Streptomyces sp. XM4193]
MAENDKSTARGFYARKLRMPAIAAAAAAGLLGGLALSTPAAQAAPPTPPSKAEALSLLNGLPVAAPGSMDGYDRDLFPHWISQGDNCDTREIVLQRDGTNVETDDQCRAVGGSWYSEYDDTTVNDSSDIDIDHIVPLAEAWRSGATDWSESKRQSFANNLTAAQLIAVSASSNRSKGDKDPADWMPRAGYQCVYARSWVGIKSDYAMNVDEAEKAALTSALNAC